jgi:gas vesicle protein
VAYGGKAGETRTSQPLSRNRTLPAGALATGIAIGLVVGAGIALLFSPASGSDTRRSLRRGLRRARHRSRDAWTDLGDELADARRRWIRARRKRLRGLQIEAVENA